MTSNQRIIKVLRKVLMEKGEKVIEERTNKGRESVSSFQIW